MLWLAYPILGIGQRNQTDMYRDMPGGLDGMRDLTEAFHNHRVPVCGGQMRAAFEMGSPGTGRHTRKPVLQEAP